MEGDPALLVSGGLDSTFNLVIFRENRADLPV